MMVKAGCFFFAFCLYPFCLVLFLEKPVDVIDVIEAVVDVEIELRNDPELFTNFQAEQTSDFGSVFFNFEQYFGAFF